MRTPPILALVLLLAAGCAERNRSRPTSDTHTSALTDTAPEHAERPPRTIFPDSSPRVDADSPRREPRRFLVPAQLVVNRTPLSISIAVDQSTLDSITLDVGQSMLTGAEYELLLYCGDELVFSGATGRSAGSTFAGATRFLNASDVGIPQPGQAYLLEYRYSLFETSVPVQHMWSPHNGQYRTLWTHTIRHPIP